MEEEALKQKKETEVADVKKTEQEARLLKISEKIAADISIKVELKADEVKQKEEDKLIADELAEIEKDKERRKATESNSEYSDFDRDEEAEVTPIAPLVTPSKVKDAKVDSLVEEALQLSA